MASSFILPIISGLAGLFGGGASKQTNQQTQQNSQFNQTGTTNQSGSTAPNLSPLQSVLENLFGSGAENLADNPINLGGYEAGGLQQINNASDIASKNIANQLAARGLSFSPYAGTAMAQPAIAAAGQQSQFVNQLPLLQRQLQQNNLSSLIDAFRAMPFGTTSTSSGTTTANGTSSGTSDTRGTTSTPGGPLAGLFSGLGAGFAAGGGFPSFGGGGSGMNFMNNLPLLSTGMSTGYSPFAGINYGLPNY